MTAPAVAEQAVHVRDSEEGVRDVGGLLVPDILLRAAGHATVNHPVEFPWLQVLSPALAFISSVAICL